MKTLRSIVALVGGFALMGFSYLLLVVIAATLLDPQAASFRTVSGLLFSPAGALGGYATASLAITRPLAHAAILAACMLGMAVPYTFKPPSELPWNPVLVAATAPLCMLAFGWLRTRQLSKRVTT